MRVWKDRPLLRGRLHGRLLKFLGMFAALAAVVAVWQFIDAMDGDAADDRNVVIDDPPLGGGMNDVASSAPSEEASPPPSESPTTAAPSEAAEEEGSSAPAESDEPEPIEEPTGPQCVASLSLATEWGNTISVSVEVTNTGQESFEGWEVVLDIEDVEVTAAWGMDHVEGDRYQEGWTNGDLDPGESTEPSLSAERKGRPELPETVPCSPTG